jgi:hypothetical protein
VRYSFFEKSGLRRAVERRQTLAPCGRHREDDPASQQYCAPCSAGVVGITPEFAGRRVLSEMVRWRCTQSFAPVMQNNWLPIHKKLRLTGTVILFYWSYSNYFI